MHGRVQPSADREYLSIPRCPQTSPKVRKSAPLTLPTIYTNKMCGPSLVCIWCREMPLGKECSQTSGLE